MALLGVAAVNAGNAANYGARMGAVAVQTSLPSNPAGVASASASQAVQAAPVGAYGISVSGSGAPEQWLALLSLKRNFLQPVYTTDSIPY